MKVNWSVVGILAIVAIVFIGEWYAYVPDHNGFSSDAEFDGDSVDYRIRSNGAYTYNAVLLDNHGMKPVDKLYIYRDTSYGYIEDGTVHAVGSQPLTEEYYIDQLEKQLRIRGVTDITYLNASELRDRLTEDISTGASGRGLMFVTGVIPDTVIGSSTVLSDWISAGGYVYWAGNEMGRYMATEGDRVEIDATTAFLGTASLTDTDNAVEDTEMRTMFCFESQHLSYAPDIEAVRSSGRVALGTGYTDGEGHYTVTFIGMGAGQVCVIAGDFGTIQIRDVALSVASGLCCRSTVVDHRVDQFDKDVSGSFQTSVPGLSLYIALGQYYCPYAERHDL